LGKSANATVEMTATSKKLTHQGDRNKIANKERSDIFHFIGVLIAEKYQMNWGTL
jgi:hypothetical protein